MGIEPLALSMLARRRKRLGVLPGGEFARWLHDYLRAQTHGEPAGDVPCGECNACCKASYFIPIHSEERETIALIPVARLTRAANTNEPQWALDQSCGGQCPMLINDACSIYAQRPRTCRRYDCRVFVATGVGVGSGPRAPVNERVWRWRFDYPSALDVATQSAVLAAVAFFRRCADLIDSDIAPSDTGDLAKAAVLVHALFLEANVRSDGSDTTLAAAINGTLRQQLTSAAG